MKPREAPERCPACGSARVGPPRDPDLEAMPGVDADEAPQPHPGVRVCRDCGATVRWGD